MDKATIYQFINGSVIVVSLLIFFISICKNRFNKIGIDSENCSKTWERAFAAIFDMILLSIFFYIFYTFTTLIELTLSEKFEEIFTVLFTWLYFVVLESSKAQGSLGKMFQGIKVTDVKGQRITFIKANIRYFAKFISVFSMFLGLLKIPFSKYRQALHDNLANTLVIKRI